MKLQPITKIKKAGGYMQNQSFYKPKNSKKFEEILREVIKKAAK